MTFRFEATRDFLGRNLSFLRKTPQSLTPFPNFLTIPTTGRLTLDIRFKRTRLTYTADLWWNRISNTEHSRPEAEILSADTNFPTKVRKVGSLNPVRSGRKAYRHIVLEQSTIVTLEGSDWTSESDETMLCLFVCLFTSEHALADSFN
ncbi:hypothetical protein AVEN_146608-1 [Araneus ventricosus]|uniref:Uncharacterized protein n=1 Tax=Araneus ventricosus TaxID=182803 RepID=A0A4Y2RNQ5_ARAVE|nr:hypothetical protein AVEN_146608-1 [Araneus ventricosus]